MAPDFDDHVDFENVDRGFVATTSERELLRPDGGMAWSFHALDFIDGDCPDTVNPSWGRARCLRPAKTRA
jgi:alkyl sulfatase BDS1-like metallo-beta-lactamase superfamily hydrolase